MLPRTLDASLPKAKIGSYFPRQRGENLSPDDMEAHMAYDDDDYDYDGFTLFAGHKPPRTPCYCCLSGQMGLHPGSAYALDLVRRRGLRYVRDLGLILRYWLACRAKCGERGFRHGKVAAVPTMAWRLPCRCVRGRRRTVFGERGKCHRGTEPHRVRSPRPVISPTKRGARTGRLNLIPARHAPMAHVVLTCAGLHAPVLDRRCLQPSQPF